MRFDIATQRSFWIFSWCVGWLGERDALAYICVADVGHHNVRLRVKKRSGFHNNVAAGGASKGGTRTSRRAPGKGLRRNFDQGWDVKLDGVELGDLKTGTYAYADRPAGHHQLSSEVSMLPGVTQLDITIAPGHIYFFVAKPSDRAKAVSAMSAFGVSGRVIGTAVTSGAHNPGPLDFLPLDETTARAAIADLRMVE